MASDLSQYNKPVSDLFARPGDSISEFALSAEQVAHYHEHGFVSGIRVLTDEQVDVLRDELADLLVPGHDGHELWHEYHSNESGDPNNVLFHALGAWRIKRAFHDALWNPAFAIPASQLIGGSVRFWHDQLFCKPARHGGVVAWHQDYSYWTRTTPMQHLTCWIGLDDATIDNGCLHYVPRSHHWELLPVTGLANDMDAIQAVLNDEQKAQFKPVSIQLKKGEATFHHPHLVHGSFPNRTDRPRRGMVLNVFRDGVTSNANEPLLDGIPVVPAGQPLRGRFFPLLYECENTRQK
jgi:ectoine hydroxylase-related dioxygenase (phytanoyl-CoA dioxygenase family)